MAGLLVWTLLAIAADPAAEAPLAEQVAPSVRQLDAPQLAERDEAERKLIELGADVLPLLPPISDRTSAEVALRVTRVQQKLLKAQALSAAEPTTVTLSAEDMPLSEVLKEFAKQTGNPIHDHRQTFGEEQDDPRIKAKFDKTPFWEAFDNVLDQGGLTLYPYTGERGAFVISRPPGELPRSKGAFYNGVFRLQGARFEAARDLRNPSMESLKLFLEVTWEPRLQPFAILQPLGEVSATGSDGQPLAVAGADAEPEALIREGITAAELEIPFALPKRSVEKISSLKGKFLALVPGPVQDFRFSELPVATRNAPPRRVEQRKAGTVVSLDQVRRKQPGVGGQPAREVRCPLQRAGVAPRLGHGKRSLFRGC